MHFNYMDSWSSIPMLQKLCNMYCPIQGNPQSYINKKLDTWNSRWKYDIFYTNQDNQYKKWILNQPILEFMAPYWGARSSCAHKVTIIMQTHRDRHGSQRSCGRLHRPTNHLLPSESSLRREKKERGEACWIGNHMGLSAINQWPLGPHVLLTWLLHHTRYWHVLLRWIYSRNEGVWTYNEEL